MNKFLNPSDKEIKSVAIFYILFGILVCLFNVSILSSAIRIIGALALLICAYSLYNFFVQRSSMSTSPLFIGVLSGLAGLLMVFSPESILSMLPILVGLILVINSIVHLQKALVLKDFEYPNWKINFGISAAVLILGFILLFKPIQSLSFILQIIGISLIFEAIFMLVSQHILRKYD